MTHPLTRIAFVEPLEPRRLLATAADVIQLDGSGSADHLIVYRARDVANRLVFLRNGAFTAFEIGKASGVVVHGFGGDDVIDVTGVTGLAVTVFGDNGDDTIGGSPGDDQLFGNSGDDLLLGQAGNDLLQGGPGRDTLSGGDGIDQVSYVDLNKPAYTTARGNRYGVAVSLDGRANDGLASDKGVSIERDWVKSDVEGVIGTKYRDAIIGSGHGDFLTGGADGDTIQGGSGGDVIDAGDGPDFVYAGPGNDRIAGGEGSDYLDGGSGDDLIVGGNGDDIMVGQSGIDTLFGGNGQDRLAGGSGFDYLDGGGGSDKYDPIELAGEVRRR